eukprot:6574304-Heterocapsa_arctica.AAC.1
MPSNSVVQAQDHAEQFNYTGPGSPQARGGFRGSGPSQQLGSHAVHVSAPRRGSARGCHLAE